jgi:hypothetical protein
VALTTLPLSDWLNQELRNSKIRVLSPKCFSQAPKPPNISKEEGTSTIFRIPITSVKQLPLMMPKKSLARSRLCS